MKERPILFSASMVRAILDGRKSQTRRIVKPQPEHGLQMCHYSPTGWARNRDAEGHACTCDPARAPYGVPGDRLWVKETHAIVPRTAYAMSEGVQQALRPDDNHDAAVYAADWERSKPGRWRPSIHMPRWASRITLEITDVRVERLNDISEADALAEGAEVCANGVWFDRSPTFAGSDARGAYYCLWQHINGPGSWAANPWVWVVEFKRVTP